MALDAQGRPIPVFVPQPSPPPPVTPPPHPSPQPDIANDVNLLMAGVNELNERLHVVEKFTPEVGSLGSRTGALEEAGAAVAKTLARFSVVEDAFDNMSDLVDLISRVESRQRQNDEKIAMLSRRVDELAAMIFRAWEEGRVDPVPPS